MPSQVASAGDVVADTTGQVTVDQDSRARVIVVIQRKGGAGKSTITVNLAAVAGENNPAEPGKDAPVVGCGIDPQGSMEDWARSVPEDKLPFDYVVTKGRLGELPELVNDPIVRRIFVDTPGFMDTDADADVDADPIGDGRASEALREALEYASLAIVPITTEYLTKKPAEWTIEFVLKPREIPFMVVINQWDSQKDGPKKDDLRAAERWCDERGYPRAKHPIRKYKVHSKAAEDGLTVIQYPENGTSLRAKQDFYKLALAVEQAL